ncbi:unnamed protein product, partial [Amoebophrya sp. A120]|eukprot:GSA120T00013475001.1
MFPQAIKFILLHAGALLCGFFSSRNFCQYLYYSGTAW